MMSVSSDAAPLTLGFLTVVDQSPQGLIGGYLLLSAHARPLEFHCTVPVRASRAQEILYGSTLQPYLYGEQIGMTLLRASQLQPLAVFTDCTPALAAAAHASFPLWLVMPPSDSGSTPDSPAAPVPLTARLDPPQTALRGMTVTQCGRNRLAQAPLMSASAAIDSSSAKESTDQLLDVAAALDLNEPFERIRSAIEEAQRGGR